MAAWLIVKGVRAKDESRLDDSSLELESLGARLKARLSDVQSQCGHRLRAVLHRGSSQFLSQAWRTRPHMASPLALSSL